MRTPVRGLRRSPLRRRSDVVEAWTVLVVAVLLLVGAPLLGAATAWWGHGRAQAVAAEQRAQRHRVPASVVGTTPDALPSVQAGGQHSFRATVRWSTPDGTAKSTTARVPANTRHGDTVDIWLDARGRSAPAPADDAAIRQRGITIGALTTLGAALAVLLAHRAVRRAALRHRLAEWDRDWALTEPRWTRRRA